MTDSQYMSLWSYGPKGDNRLGIAERREREKLRRKNDILDAAEEVFSEKGLNGATVDDIADRAEISKGTIYLYFKSKEQIFLGIDIRATRILWDRFMNAAVRGENGLDKILRIGKAYFDYCEEFPMYYKAMTMVDNISAKSVEMLMNDPMAMEAEEVGKASSQILADAVEEGHKDGTVRKDAEPWPTAILLWAEANGVIQMLRNRKKHFELAGLNIENLYDLFLEKSRRGLNP